MATPIQTFFDQVIPDLVLRGDNGLLVVKKDGACGVTLYWRHKTGLDLIDSYHKLQSYVGRYYNPASDRDTQVAVAGAMAAFDCTAGWLDNPAWSVDRILHSPGLVYIGGQYVSPPKGLSLSHRTYSRVDPLMPGPATGHLSRFLDAFGLEPGARARIVAFYAGCLLRSCFGIMPALLMRSPYKNTGKSTICKLAAMMVLDTPTPPTLSWRGDDEFAKQLGVAVSESRAPVYVLDNVVTQNGAPFSSPTIATMTYSTVYETRRLGRNSSLILDRPILAISMQGGQVGYDLIDRFLYSEITARRPLVLDCDMLVFAEQHYRDIRDEIATAIMLTDPLPTDAVPKNEFRYTDFWRYVAPVVKQLGLDPELICESAAEVAQSELVELVHVIRQMCESQDKKYTLAEIHSQIVGTYHHRALRTVVSDSMSKQSQLILVRELLNMLPDVIQETGYRLLVDRDTTGPEPLYQVRLEETS